MRFVILFVVFLFVLVSFLFSGMVAFAAQATADLKKPVEHCVKGGKALPTVKTKDNCIKEGGTWVKMGAPEPPDPLGKSKARPPDPLEKSKAKLPDDPFNKSKAMPIDPLGKNKAMPPAGQIAPSGGQ